MSYLCTKYFIYNFVITRSSDIFSLNICYFSIIICFLTKPLTLGILFSTSLIFVLKTVAVTNPLTSCVFLLTSSVFFSKVCLLVLCWFMQTKVVSKGIFFFKLPSWLFSLLYLVFFYILFCYITLFLQIGRNRFQLNSIWLIQFLFLNYSFKLFNLVETLTNLLMPNLSTLAFRTIQSFLAANLDVSTPVACFNYF